ncbi:hypothetical protein ABZ682_17280 [Streptomyces griseoviridis]|uniref:hypothetical protein n=1 Tax=Streptomyces griseoviridis TaxID=45398 RepID=UPI0033C86281
MSYPSQGDFDIYVAPEPPQTARGLVDDLGVEAVRNAMPSSERRAFDTANPYRDIERACERVTAREQEVHAYDRDLNQYIARQGYSPEQAEFVRAQTADVRQPLVEAVSRAAQRASEKLTTYQENLIAHIDSRGLVQRTAAQTGQYSTPVASTSAAANLDPSGGNRAGRGHREDRGRGSRDNPLRENRGDRRQGPRR